MNSNQTVALVLNWRSPLSTVNCVRSLLRYCSELTHIVIVDNASDDGSFDEMRSKLEDILVVGKVSLIENTINSGYAGGNNFGIKYAYSNLSFEYIWIVNNDAYVSNDALSPMLARFSSVDEKKIVGSLIVSPDEKTIECYGGGTNYPILGKAKLYMNGCYINDVPVGGYEVPDYIMGCSLLLSKRLLNEVGLMDEGYFMYSEEIDWQKRAEVFGYCLDVAPDSLVYHEGSGSSGGKSPYYFFLRNRAAIRFNKKFFGFSFALISAINLSLISVLQEYRRPKNLYSAIKGAFVGLLMNVENVGTEF